MLFRRGLTFFSSAKEGDNVAVLSAVSEVVTDRGLEYLRDQVAHASKTSDDLWCLCCRDVNDLSNVQVEREAIFGSNRDRTQVFVESMGLASSVCPVENQVRRWDQLDFHRVLVDRVFAWAAWLHPNAPISFGDDVSVLECVTG